MPHQKNGESANKYKDQSNIKAIYLLKYQYVCLCPTLAHIRIKTTSFSGVSVLGT